MLFHVSSQAATSPSLSVQQISAGQIQVSWPLTATNFILEAAESLSALTSGATVILPPETAVGQFTVTMAAGPGDRFFRLRQPILTTLKETSPMDRESGVAVTRETILHFSEPLAANTVIETNILYATFAGRRILSRSEMSSDRRKVTLFYLEPLPGSARISVFFDGDAVKDMTGRAVDADGDGNPGGEAMISFDTLSLSPLGSTAVIGTVYAAELAPGPDTGTNAVNRPLAGVTITVDGREESLRTVTDTNGNFKLAPVPAGRFFVHIDGRTVTNLAENVRYPDKAYYPFVGKAWDAVAGREDNLAGGTGKIYLPLITEGTLQTVSQTSDTVVTFPPSVLSNNPALAGVTITVPANSLFSDDGTRGGKVGIAAVPPDRLPGPLPPGLELPIVITVQSDGGLNFDRPAPICFPNLTDPVLGTPLPAGSKQSLISFNHDEGIWEAVGSMTVSADGKMICTDPGVGVLQPGWHGVGCPPQNPPPKPEAECIEANLDECIRNCELLLKDWRRRNDQILAQEAQVCEALKRAGLTQDWHECVSNALGEFYQRQKRADEFFKECLDGCRSCYITGASASANASTFHVRGSSVETQLTAILDQIIDLVSPYFSTNSPLPAEILSQVESLHAQANNLVGGDAAAYLKSLIIEDEETRAAQARLRGHEPDDSRPGNAPEYPVLYTARISRPSGRFFLRGETGPYGQYTLFVPRDGVLLDVSFFDPRTKRIGMVMPNLSTNLPYQLPRFTLVPLSTDEIDRDADHLPDIVEEIYGTNPTKADTDGDGISDGAEVEQGTDPLGGLVTRTGVIASVKTPAAAIDISTGNNLAVLAQGTNGVSIINISELTRPTIIAHLDTPGTALRSAFSGDLVAVADGPAGLAVIDVSDPTRAGIARQINLSGAQAVTAGAGLAYVGLSSGEVVVIDLFSGEILNSLSVTNPVADLALGGDNLYALTGDRLHVIPLSANEFKVAGTVLSPFVAAQNRRLFVGDGLAYTVHRKGYNTVDVSNPAAPVLLTHGNTTQFGWKQIVPNGSGLGLAAVGANSTDDGPHDVSLYDLTDPRTNDVFVTTLLTPGVARSVSIFNGLGYVADDTAGLQIVSYMPYDANGAAPTISLQPGFTSNSVEEGKITFATARVSDDVQVRTVEFYLDGTNVFTDGAFPFEFRFTTPTITINKTNFLLRARAFDTGGNFAWTEVMTIPLVPDSTPPRVLRGSPAHGAKVVSTVSAYFDSPIDAATLNQNSFTLVSAGLDSQLGTGDDLPIQTGIVSYRPETTAGMLSFSSPLPDGLYRATLFSNITDVAGNRLTSEYSWQFRVADALFWISRANGSWNESRNWSTGVIPGQNDDVIIDVFPENPTVNLPMLNVRFRSLRAHERIQMDGGSVQLSGTMQLHRTFNVNGGTIRGGTVTQTNAGKLTFANNYNTIDSVTFDGDLDLTTGNAFIGPARLAVRNRVTVSGAIRLDNGANIDFPGTQSLTGGSIVFGPSTGDSFLNIPDNSTLTLGPAVVVRGKSGTIGQFIAGRPGTKLINQGFISVDVAGGTLTINPSQFENTGTIRADGSGATVVIRSTFTNTGQIEELNGGRVLINP